MSDDSLGFAAPPFDADAALQRLRRELRELGLTEREGAFERAGLPVARISRGEGPVIEASIARQPARSPQWQPRTLRDSAAARTYVADLKKRLAGWSNHDE